MHVASYTRPERVLKWFQPGGPTVPSGGSSNTTNCGPNRTVSTGALVGATTGGIVGTPVVGDNVGMYVGTLVGDVVGEAVGTSVGETVGALVGAAVGAVGVAVGKAVGENVGEFVLQSIVYVPVDVCREAVTLPPTTACSTSYDTSSVLPDTVQSSGSRSSRSLAVVHRYESNVYAAPMSRSTILVPGGFSEIISLSNHFVAVSLSPRRMGPSVPGLVPPGLVHATDPIPP